MGSNKIAHGGELVDLYADEKLRADLTEKSIKFASWDLTDRQICDLELLLNGAFSPLRGFMTQDNYQSVLDNLRLIDGTLWPMPITLDVTEELATNLKKGDKVALRDIEGVMIAVLTVESIWQPNFEEEAKKVFGTTDDNHPAVRYLNESTHPYYIGGELVGMDAPIHYDFKRHRYTPTQLRDYFERRGWRKVVAFQTRNPMHRAHVELTFRAASQAEANLLIHPVVGMTKPGDIDHFTRVRCYEKVLDKYPEQTSALALLPLAMRMGGPREAVWHAIIRKNYGCTHFIVGRDHAGPGNDKNGNPFYGPYDAQDLVNEYADELDITMVPFQEMVYVQELAQYQARDEVRDEHTVLNISGTEFRRRLREGVDIDEWFSYPEVVDVLRQSHPPRFEQGFTVFFTGLSGSGKSTIANALRTKLMEVGTRPVTLLDGDEVRKNLSSELGFSKEHRDLNIRRIGYVASEITKNRGIAICAPIAPYATTRRVVREGIEQFGGFIEIYVSTPVEECERRDRKGLYAKARAGIIKEFTGISDPYEVPENAEMVIDTAELSPDQAAQKIILKLENLGFIR